MKRVGFLVSSVLVAGCASGPHLGAVTNVVVGKMVIAEPQYAEQCGKFKLSVREARSFLNRAILVTPYDLHHSYYTSPCSISGTAEFRGLPGTWTIGVGGTGVVTLLDEFRYDIADPKQEDDEG
jgi:hypothetical protein